MTLTVLHLQSSFELILQPEVNIVFLFHVSFLRYTGQVKLLPSTTNTTKAQRRIQAILTPFTSVKGAAVGISKSV